mgnify:CR=1 FL=1
MGRDPKAVFGGRILKKKTKMCKQKKTMCFCAFTSLHFVYFPLTLYCTLRERSKAGTDGWQHITFPPSRNQQWLIIFNNDFINLNDFDSVDAMVERIKEIDQNETLYKQYAEAPLFVGNAVPDKFKPAAVLDFFQNTVLS